MSIRLFVAIALCVIGSAGSAHAYLDPGTGSMILQLLLGGIAGALVVVKLYWLKLKQFFVGKPTDTSVSGKK